MRLPRSPALDPALDERLIERCRKGEATAWAALVRRYERLVYAVARGYRLDPEDLADTFQEVFSALVRGLPNLRDARSLCRWLTSTTDRIALATALRRRREQARDAGPAERMESQLVQPDPAGADLERIEEQMGVRLAMSALAARCRGLLDALYFHDPAPGYREIAKRLGIPVGSIGPTRARCLEKLEQALRALESDAAGISGAARPTSPDEKGRVRGGSTRAAGPLSRPPRTEEIPHVS